MRQYDLGSTQWYVLYQLANDGPTMQRDLGQLLRIERATLSGIVSTLVRKGLVEQIPDLVDQRQRVLRLSASGGEALGRAARSDAIVQAVSFKGTDATELATALRALQAGTQRLNDHMTEGNKT